MRPLTRILLALVIPTAWAQDPAELVRKSISQDQLSWVRMKDYTWQARSLERHYNSHGQIESKKQE
ncbi:MAG TPA: hypothetical protein VHW24_27230, partial [Bryobacteraceae bacterium]|nr:hypothetical protein [Bryobacteraceae bacterium]